MIMSTQCCHGYRLTDTLFDSLVLVSEEIEYREEPPAEVTEVGVTQEKM